MVTVSAKRAPRGRTLTIWPDWAWGRPWQFSLLAWGRCAPGRCSYCACSWQCAQGGLAARAPGPDLPTPTGCAPAVGSGEVARDAAHQRIGQLLLVGAAAQALFFGVADEGGFRPATLGMSGALSTAKPACSTRVFVQLAHIADLAQQHGAELEAVVDLRGGAHVQQRALHMLVLDCVDAAHQVGLVFLVGQPAGGGAGGTALGSAQTRWRRVRQGW